MCNSGAASFLTDEPLEGVRRVGVSCPRTGPGLRVSPSPLSKTPDSFRDFGVFVFAANEVKYSKAASAHVPAKTPNH
jgi:hypothetical protein